jgi:hypothetical protein
MKKLYTIIALFILQHNIKSFYTESGETRYNINKNNFYFAYSIDENNILLTEEETEEQTNEINQIVTKEKHKRTCTLEKCDNNCNSPHKNLLVKFLSANKNKRDKTIDQLKYALTILAKIKFFQRETNYIDE